MKIRKISLVLALLGVQTQLCHATYGKSMHTISPRNLKLAQQEALQSPEKETYPQLTPAAWENPIPEESKDMDLLEGVASLENTGSVRFLFQNIKKTK